MDIHGSGLSIGSGGGEGNASEREHGEDSGETHRDCRARRGRLVKRGPFPRSPLPFVRVLPESTRSESMRLETKGQGTQLGSWHPRWLETI